MRADDWARLSDEQRHSALVHASDLATAEPGTQVFALESAAAVWGLPRVGRWPEHVTVLATGPRTRGSRLLKVHVGADADPVIVEGVRVTGAARTVVDLARTGSFETALCAADHALRHALCTASELGSAAADVRPRVRGRPAAALVAELADGRSMSPGESLSRARMFLLNLPRPDLQVELEDDEGLIGIADFGWPGVIGEFDGRTKYGVTPGSDPTTAAQVLWQEKVREDRIRRQARLARWTWSDAMVPSRLARVLAGQGVHPQPRNTWVDLAARGAS
jgi:hypothetical protein